MKMQDSDDSFQAESGFDLAEDELRQAVLQKRLAMHVRAMMTPYEAMQKLLSAHGEQEIRCTSTRIRVLSVSVPNPGVLRRQAHWLQTNARMDQILRRKRPMRSSCLLLVAYSQWLATPCVLSLSCRCAATICDTVRHVNRNACRDKALRKLFPTKDRQPN